MLERQMKLAPNRCSIVLPGAWNIAIFSPEWLKEHFADTVHVELSIANGRLATAVTMPQASMLLSDSKVVIRPVGTDVGDLAQCAALAERLLIALPETPVTAFGINVCFDVLGSESPSLNELLETGATERAAFQSTPVEATGFMRRLSNSGAVVNLQVAVGVHAPVQVDLNHHHVVEPKKAVNVAAKIIRFADEAERVSADLLKHAYGLELNG